MIDLVYGGDTINYFFMLLFAYVEQQHFIIFLPSELKPPSFTPAEHKHISANTCVESTYCMHACMLWSSVKQMSNETRAACVWGREQTGQTAVCWLRVDGMELSLRKLIIKQRIAWAFVSKQLCVAFENVHGNGQACSCGSLNRNGLRQGLDSLRCYGLSRLGQLCHAVWKWTMMIQGVLNYALEKFLHVLNLLGW
jgi:hypothetical protein